MTVIFLIGVVIYYASVWGININLDDVTSPEYVPMYKSTFCSLSGMLALGLFIHNAIITIVSNNRYPENIVSYLFSLDTALRVDKELEYLFIIALIKQKTISWCYLTSIVIRTIQF